MQNAWDVFVVFMIPFGGGIPAGVVLGHSRGLGWPLMTLVYICSDIVLAIIFDSLIYSLKYLSRRYTLLLKMGIALRLSVAQTTARFGAAPGPLSLILISFGVDPMTGRLAGLFVGHGFLLGWTFAIIGDLFFFWIIMASTLLLNNILGDGTLAAIIIMVAMFAVPAGFRRVRSRFRRPEKS